MHLISLVCIVGCSVAQAGASSLSQEGHSPAGVAGEGWGCRRS